MKLNKTYSLQDLRNPESVFSPVKQGIHHKLREVVYFLLYIPGVFMRGIREEVALDLCKLVEVHCRKMG